MRKVLLTVAALLLCLPGMSEAQESIRYYPPAGTAGMALNASVAPATTTQGTSEEALYTFTIPANTLSANGKGFYIVAHSTTAANVNAKRLRVRLNSVSGAQAFSTLTSVSAAQMSGFAFCIRTSASTMSCIAYSEPAAAAASLLTGLDFTAALPVLVTSLTATAAGDVTLTAATLFTF